MADERCGWRCSRRGFRVVRMPVMVVIGVLLAVLMAASAVPRRAGADDLPKGEQVLDNMIRAQGGADAFAAQKNRVTYSSMEVKPMGVRFGVIEYAARPNLSYLTVTNSQFGNIESGVKDDLAWENSSLAGPKIKEGIEKADALRESEFDGLVSWRKLYSSVTCVGIDSVDGQPCYRVIMVPLAGSPDTSLVSRETGLLVQSRTTLETDMGKVPAIVHVGDYRKVGGVLWPFRTRQVIMGGLQEIVLSTDSIRVNVDLPADRFEPPAEVKALLKGNAGEGERGPGKP